jgi:hypothetical protein
VAVPSDRVCRNRSVDRHSSSRSLPYVRTIAYAVTTYDSAAVVEAPEEGEEPATDRSASYSGPRHLRRGLYAVLRARTHPDDRHSTGALSATHRLSQQARPAVLASRGRRLRSEVVHDLAHVRDHVLPALPGKLGDMRDQKVDDHHASEDQRRQVDAHL